MKEKKFYCLLLFVLCLATGCGEIKTNDSNDSYKYWAGTKPPFDIKVINGQYWQSNHWTKEYILYMQLQTTPQWTKEFIKQNSLQTDTSEWDFPKDAPDWFLPPDDYQMWDSFDAGNSRYFIDSSFKEIFFYEIQL